MQILMYFIQFFHELNIKVGLLGIGKSIELSCIGF